MKPSFVGGTVSNFALFRGYLERHRDELRVGDQALASFVCVAAIEALTHNAVLHCPKTLSGDAMAALVEACARLVGGYLMGGGARFVAGNAGAKARIV